MSIFFLSEVPLVEVVYSAPTQNSQPRSCSNINYYKLQRLLHQLCQLLRCHDEDRTPPYTRTHTQTQHYHINIPQLNIYKHPHTHSTHTHTHTCFIYSVVEWTVPCFDFLDICCFIFLDWVHSYNGLVFIRWSNNDDDCHFHNKKNSAECRPKKAAKEETYTQTLFAARSSRGSSETSWAKFGLLHGICTNGQNEFWMAS